MSGPVGALVEALFGLEFEHARAGAELGDEGVPVDGAVEGHGVEVGVAGVVVDVAGDDVGLEFGQGVGLLAEALPPVAVELVVGVVLAAFPGIGGHDVGVSGVVTDADGGVAGEGGDDAENFLCGVGGLKAVFDGDDESEPFGGGKELFE